MRFTVRARVRRVFRLALRRRDLTEQEIDEELRLHVELRISHFMARGLTRTEAERETFHRLGASWEETMDALRSAGRVRDDRLAARERLADVLADLAYAIRTITRQPGFAMVVILTFALGIGANATMFGVIDRLLLRPPPHVREPDGVFELSRLTQRDGKVRHETAMQYPLYAALRSDTSAFRGVAATSFITTQSLGSGAEAVPVTVVFASSNYFSLLGTEPSLGRFFGAGEDGEVAVRDVAIVSYGFWQRRFGADPNVLGKSIRVGPRDVTVIGVAREGFTGVDPVRIDIWLPLSHAEVFGIARPPWNTMWGNIWLRVLLRLRPGVAPEAVSARARTLLENGLATFGGGKGRQMREFRDASIAVRSILPSTQLADDPQAKLARLLLGVTIVVLLIACANVASLLLARGTERRREIAVRLALGVSRSRLLRLLFAETVVLAVCGGALAVAVAYWGIRLLQATLLSDFAWTESAFDGRVIAATTALVVVTIVLAGFLPAARSSRPNVVDSLKAGGREGGVGVSRLRTGLMMAQASLSVVLIVGAGLFVQSLRQAASFRLGYDTTGVIAASIDVTSLGYKTPARRALYESMQERVAALPGVASVSTATTYALLGWLYGIRVSVPGRDSLPPAPNGMMGHNAVGRDYFSTLGVRIMAGRAFESADFGPETRVAILNESMARAYWPDESAVGQCIVLNGDAAGCTTVVGVAADAKEGPRRADPPWLVYVPDGSRWNSGPNVLLVRSRGGDERRLIEPIRRAMQGTAPNLPYAEVQTLDDVFAPEIRPWKTGVTLFSLFGGLALLMAAMGLYSAISYTVVQRTHEFGVRMALGARIEDVIRLVMDQGVRAALVGVAAGSAVAFALRSVIEPLLFQTSPSSPWAYGVAAAVIVVVAAGASFVPAWRASRVDPVTALRGE